MLAAKQIIQRDYMSMVNINKTESQINFQIAIISLVNFRYHFFLITFSFLLPPHCFILPLPFVETRKISSPHHTIEYKLRNNITEFN